MSDDITPAVAPAAPEAQAAPAEKTYSEAEKNAAIQAAIQDRFKNAPTKEQIAELQAAKEQLDALKAEQMTEVERAKAEADAAKAELEAAKAATKEAQLAAVRLRIATEKGLDPKVAPFLAGGDEAAIAEAADIIAAAMPKPSALGGNPPLPDGDPAEKDPFIRGLRGK